VPVVAIVTGIAPIVGVLALLIANLGKFRVPKFNERPWRGTIGGPPRFGDLGGGDLGGVREPRSPVAPAGAAAAALEEPDLEFDHVEAVAIRQAGGPNTPRLRAS
jgi:hypothetical protein